MLYSDTNERLSKWAIEIGHLVLNLSWSRLWKMKNHHPLQILYVLLPVWMTFPGRSAAFEELLIDRTPPFHSDDIFLPSSLCGKCDQFDAVPSLNPCVCYCDRPNKHSFFEPSWKCIENRKVRLLSGMSSHIWTLKERTQHLFWVLVDEVWTTFNLK